uniref:Uncharacterized protein n=1 Tax=Romanomermis culicivorax TaxID=13658 RepID=A0A915IZW3_ROMCU
MRQIFGASRQHFFVHGNLCQLAQETKKISYKLCCNDADCR